MPELKAPEGGLLGFDLPGGDDGPGDDEAKKLPGKGDKAIGKKIAEKAADKLGEKVGEKLGKIVEKNVKGGGEILGAVTDKVASELIEWGADALLNGKKKNVEEAVAEQLPEFTDIAVTSTPKRVDPAKPDAGVAKFVGDALRKLGDKNFKVTIGSGDTLDVRQFSIHERLSSLFQVNLVAVSDNPSIEFDEVVGQPAQFSMSAGMHDKFWSGICNHFEQVRHEPGGMSTYQFSIVPTLWLLTQRKNYRMHQQISEPDIVLKMLEEWGIKPVEQYDKGAYKKRKYRVQYNESDYAFMCRMLEDAGITFYFRQGEDETELVLSDAPHSNSKREPSLTFKDDTSLTNAVHTEFVTSVRMGQRVRPGKYTMRDHDYRKPPTYKLMSMASKGLAIEEKLERFQYVPGAFLFGTDSGEATPSADDRGKTRTDEKEAQLLAQKRLDAKRGSARTATFETNAFDLAPGVVLSITGHGHGALGEDKTLLVVESSLSGTTNGEWSQHCEVRGTDIPFRPELATPRPKTQGVESATVVGPPGEEIHCDEFGRVRVHFHWDRESKMDDSSSCWIHVSQPWGGAGYGGTALPRVGQEVLVDFLGGDPDRPVIVGRVYTNLQKTPYKLPDNKTQTGLRSNSTGGGGGYNEIMFEDAKGKELVNMQAEKDLKKLVKNDESVTIGHDRTKQIGHDDALVVGHDRTRQVVHDEMVQIGNDRTRLVGNNESITVGSNRTKTIGANETLTVGQNQSERIGQNRSVDIGLNHEENIGANMSLSVGGALSETVGKAKTETVALASAETVGGAKALTVGGAYAITVGGMMATNVALVQSENVGLTKTITVGNKVTIACGASTITMDKAGTIVVSGKDISVQAQGTVNVDAQGVVNVKSAANVNVRGSTIDMN
ncbi:MAG: type VI secretion system tip protein VgrG [Polyangiaceae bacterium]|nr:type VI secretion system tip protein VgrG [Polyangiaceae bacterium]